LSFYYQEWLTVTNDKEILSWVQGIELPFTEKPIQNLLPKQGSFTPAETIAIHKEINNLLQMGAIVTCEHCKDEFLSPIFLVPKPNGKYRFILNLKSLNQFLDPPHFKLEDVRCVLNLITRNAYMATLDLKDAYYFLPINMKFRKYLRFKWNENLYEFTCLPFGLSIAPFIFAKLTKPIVSILRKNGNVSVVYLDDFWLCGESYQLCHQNVTETIKLLSYLGFVINYTKSDLIPKQEITYLGLIFNSEKYQVSLPDAKIEKLRLHLNKLIWKDVCTIQKLAILIGLLVSSRYAIPYSILYTKRLERQKYLALKSSGQDYNASVKITQQLRDDMNWWLRQLDHPSCQIRTDQFDLTIFTDASLTGWGAHCGNNKTHGFWSLSESKLHINTLELLAIFYGLKCFARNVKNSQILLRVDNTSAISYINKMGGVQFENLSNLAREIWKWCEQKNIWLFASYIPSKLNVVADEESRSTAFEYEWQLNPLFFQKICCELGVPKIDLFATCANAHCKRFVSWLPDPDAIAVDAFTLDWSDLEFYAFPPFSILTRVIKKIEMDEATGILVFPMWPSQTWFPKIDLLKKSEIILFSPKTDMLLSPFRSVHPLAAQLTLGAVKLSGKRTN